MEYPRRDSHFAHRAFRIMHKSCAAAEMGRDAFAIVAVVLHTEDAARYRGPVTFWNSQLMETLGFAKWDSFNKARQKAIDAGWLMYEPVGKRRAGRYFVTVPAHCQGIPDTPLEDDYAGDITPGSIPDNGDNSGCNGRDKQGVNEGIKRESKRGQSGGKGGYPSTLPLPLDPAPVTETASAVSSSDDDRDEGGLNAGWVLDTWNEAAAKCPELKQARAMTRDRAAKARVRLRQAGWTEIFLDALERLPVPNDDRFRWQPDLDWMLANETNVLKIVEGKYDRRQQEVPF